MRAVFHLDPSKNLVDKPNDLTPEYNIDRTPDVPRDGAACFYGMRNVSRDEEKHLRGGMSMTSIFVSKAEP